MRWYACNSLTASSGTCYNLEKLDLSNTLLDSLDGLNSLERLQVLKIDNTGVDKLEPVTGCKALRYIYCDNTKVGKVDIDKFLDNNPDCLIIYQTSLLKSWWSGLSPAWKTVFRAHTQLDEPPTREQLQTLAGLNVLDMAGNREITSLEPLHNLTSPGRIESCKRHSAGYNAHSVTWSGLKSLT